MYNANYGGQSVPCHVESEKCILGCMLRSADTAESTFEALQAEDFYSPENREIYSAMQAVSAAGKPVDLVTLDAELSRRGKLDIVGGAAYLIEISRSVPSAANAPAYIRIITEKATLRRLLAATEKINQACYSGEEDVQNVVEEAERRIFEISMRRGSGEELEPVQPLVLSAFEEIETLVKNKGRVDSVETGYRALDELLHGFHPGEMIVVAGRPGMGKTSIGMNFIENAAIRGGKVAAVFSLEMPKKQILLRMFCTEARVDMSKVMAGQVGEKEWERLCDAAMTIGSSQMYIDATPGMNISQIRSKARRLKREHGLDIILIDYLSLMTTTGKFGNRQEEVSQISRSIKALAMELNVPIIALQQLSRSPANRSDHRPLLSDLRESGAIEQDADVVMFVHRESYYDPNAEEKDVAELNVAKQRNGPLGCVKLGWKGEYTWFMDLSPYPKEAH